MVMSPTMLISPVWKAFFEHAQQSGVILSRADLPRLTEKEVHAFSSVWLAGSAVVPEQRAAAGRAGGDRAHGHACHLGCKLRMLGSLGSAQ